MASPFRVFRKYQKTLLVIAGVVLMFVFVVGDSLVPYLSGGGGDQDGGPAPNATAVSWNGGELTNAELDMLTARRRLVMEFLRMIEYSGRLAAFEAGKEPQPLTVEMLNLPEMPEQGVEQSVVQSAVLAQAARDAGMVVSNENIRQYLEALGRGAVSPDDMRSLIERMQGAGRGVNVDFMVNALREELLARNYLASYRFALETVTPEQRWQDWLRLNDRIVIEAAAFPAESFLVDVKAPSEEQLVAFYNDHKEREPLPERFGVMELPSKTPGFKVPRKFDVKYIVANYDTFLEQVAAKVTDEEIQKYYDEKKDPLFIKTDTALFDTEESESPPPASEAETPETEEETAESSESTDAATGSEADSTEANADEAADTSSPDETSAAEEAAAPAPEDSSRLDRGEESSVFRLAAFLQEPDDSQTPAEESATETTATEAETGTDSAAPANAPAEDDTAEAPAPTDDAESEPTAADAPAESAPIEADTSETDASSESAAEKPLEFQPLEEVRDEIRRQIAEERVADQLIPLMDDLQNQLNDEFNKYFSAVLDAEAAGKPRPEPPAALADLESLAAKHGLEAGQTGLMSLLELRDKHPIGRSVRADVANENANREALLELLRIKELELYQPEVTVDIDGNRYVAMLVNETEEKVPALDEIRDEVVRAWKLQEAAALAQKHAEQVAKEAQQSGAPLSEFFAGDQSIQVIKTDPFSQYTGGAVSPLTGQPQPLRLDEPEGIVAAGPEFMEQVFALGEDEVGAVLNHDHSIAYVVKVVDHQATPAELHQDYLAEANYWDGMIPMTVGRYRTAQQLVVLDLLADANIEWERDPVEQLALEEETAESDADEN